MKNLFYGKIAVGKSSVIKNVFNYKNIPFIDFNKDIWNHYGGNEKQAKSSIKHCIKYKNKELYINEIIRLSKNVNWYGFFNKNANYEVPEFGILINKKCIPFDIINEFKIYKVMCYLDTRELNIKDKKLNPIFVQTMDSFFEEPFGIKPEIIFNEDILGERTK